MVLPQNNYIQPPRTVNVESTEYTHFLVPFSIVCILVYPVGVNALYIVLLWRNRTRIRLEKDSTVDANEKQKVVGDGTMVRFLHQPYDTNHFWWEAVDSVCADNNTDQLVLPSSDELAPPPRVRLRRLVVFCL